MDQGVTELIGLLKAFVAETPLPKELIEQMDSALPQVLYYAKLHNVIGIWAYKVQEYYLQNPPANDEEQEILDVAQKIFTLAIMRSEKREKHYQKLSQALKHKGIDHLVFKGIVIKEFYPVPGLRTFGDVDFVIRKEDRGDCHDLMQALDYEVVVGYEPVYTYRKDEQLYEIHTKIMSVNITERADYIGYFQNLWRHASKTDNHVFTFTAEFHFVYLLSHIAKHIYGSGAGIRMYLDLALYIKAIGKTLDWDWIQEELKKLKLTQFFSLTLHTLRRWFGTEIPVELPEVAEDLLEEFSAFTMESGVFGFEGRKSGEQLVRKQENKKGLRVKALQKNFFPSAKTLKSRYTYLETHEWLLPVAWVDRVFRNFGRLRYKMEEAKDIIAMREEDLQKINTFYRKIGL